MSTQPHDVDTATIENLLNQIRGVVAARVVRDASGQIDEIHVVGTPQRSAKQMVRDVESILYVRGGLRVDHRKISLVQVDETAIQPPTVRVRLLEISEGEDEHGPMITVTLSVGNQHLQGTGHSRPGEDNRPDLLAAYATVHAISNLIGPRGLLRLENLERQSFGQIEVCLSHLSLITDDGIETLLGISVLRGNELAVASRAVLDAINRPLQRLLAGSSAFAH